MYSSSFGPPFRTARGKCARQCGHPIPVHRLFRTDGPVSKCPYSLDPSLLMIALSGGVTVETAAFARTYAHRGCARSWSERGQLWVRKPCMLDVISSNAERRPCLLRYTGPSRTWVSSCLTLFRMTHLKGCASEASVLCLQLRYIGNAPAVPLLCYFEENHMNSH